MLYKVYVHCSKDVVQMPVKASAEKRELILKIYKYFGDESKRKAPFYAWNKVIDRTVQALDISRSILNKILKKEPVELNEKSVNECKDSLDSFDKDLIRRVVVGFFFRKMNMFQLENCVSLWRKTIL